MARFLGRHLYTMPALLLFFQASVKPAPYQREATLTHTEKALHIAANSPRPLAQAIDGLQRKYDWLVNYEDPQYVSEMDLKATPDLKTRPSTWAAPVRLPNGGAFDVDLPVAAATALPDEKQVLEALVDSYNHSNNPGRFELRKEQEQNFDVVGTSAHDEKGGLSKQAVILDLPITLPGQPLSALATVELILQQVSLASHIDVTLGISPRSLLGRTDVTVGGTKVAARTLLARTLAATNRKFWWRMLFNPESKSYLFSLHLK